MERVKYITHKWMQILLLDFSYCGADDAQKTMDIARWTPLVGQLWG
jgi:hypothetical protein